VGAKVEHAEWNPGLGCITKSKRHREEIARQRGLIEVGSESPESIRQHYERERREKREASYDQALKEVQEQVNG